MFESEKQSKISNISLESVCQWAAQNNNSPSRPTAVAALFIFLDRVHRWNFRINWQTWKYLLKGHRCKMNMRKKKKRIKKHPSSPFGVYTSTAQLSFRFHLHKIKLKKENPSNTASAPAGSIWLTTCQTESVCGGGKVHSNYDLPHNSETCLMK